MSGVITDRTALSAILSRAVTMAQGCNSPHVDDDLAMLRRIQPRFLGRAAYVWLIEEDDDAHFDKAGGWAARVHTEVDTDIVIQACLFEAIYPEADDIPIPTWVFTDLGQAVEQRHFSWQAMIGKIEAPDQGTGTTWHGGGVPDLMCDETIRWFYYRAVRYLQAGFEALHLGQAHLIAGADPGYRRLAMLCQLIRKAAAIHSRRGWVILDAHSHGIAVDGELLFDFCSMPMSSRCLADHPPHIALVHRGGALGGKHPGGWRCEVGPILREQDNWLGYSMPGDARNWLDSNRRAQAGKWGWDDITWLAYLTPEQRADFLRYARQWVALQGPDCYYQPAINRSLGQAAMTTHTGTVIKRYVANRPSAEVPHGFGDEDVIAELLAAESLADPLAAHRPSGTPQSSWQTLTPITVVGELQSLIGGVPGEASCPWSALHHVTDEGFARTFVAPMAGVFSFHLACGGTNTHQIRANGTASGPTFRINLPAAGTAFRITLEAESRTVTVTDVATGADLLIDPATPSPTPDPVTKLGQVAF